MKKLFTKARFQAALFLICLTGLAKIGLSGANIETRTPDGRLVKQKWPTQLLPLPWKMNKEDVPNSNVSFQEALDAVTRAYDHWQNIETSSVAFVYDDTTSIREPGADGENVVTFVSETEVFPPGVLAVAAVFALTDDFTFSAPPDFDGDGDADFPAGSFPAGTIVDADVVFNTSENEFSNDLRPGAWDIEDVAAHEIGHTLGLAHTIIPSAIMFPTVQLPLRVLGADDIAAISDLYPNDLTDTQFGRITGSVRSGVNGEAIAGAFLTAINEDTGEEIGAISGQLLAPDINNDGTISPEEVQVSSGSFTIPGLVPGQYRLQLTPIDGNPVLPEQINNTAIFGTAATPANYPEEFIDAQESNADLADDFKLLTVTAGTANSGNDFITNQTDVPQPGRPRISEVSPDSVIRGVTQNLSISGENFQDGAMVSFSGAGITVGNLTFTSESQLDVNVTVAATAPLGNRNVTVTNPGGLAGAGVGLLRIVAATPTPGQNILGVENAIATVGEQGVPVPISLSNSGEVGGFSFTLKFDPLTLAPTDVMPTGRSAAFEHLDFNVSDSLLIVVAIADLPGGNQTPPIPAGSGPIAEILFDISPTALPGDAVLAFVDAQLSDPGGNQNIIADLENGKIEIRPAFVGPKIEVDPLAHDYGGVAVNSTALQNFRVSNIGTEDLSVTATGLIGQNTDLFSIEAGSAPFTLSAGESQNVLVSFRPDSEGDKTATLQIESNDPDEPVIEVELTGFGGVPEIEIFPQSLDYGDVFVGFSSTLTVFISNFGSAILTVTNTSLSGPDADQFRVESPLDTFTVERGEDIGEILVSFTPTSGGIKTATLTIQSDAPGDPVIDVPIAGNGAFGPNIVVAPHFHDFGSVSIDSIATTSFTVSNQGNEDLSVSSVGIIGQDAAEFEIETPGPSFILMSRDSLEVIVNFKPTFEGAKNATLRFESNDTDQPVLDIPLIARAGSPVIFVSPTALNYGNVMVGSSSSRTFSVQNRGIVPLRVEAPLLVGEDSTQFVFEEQVDAFELLPGRSKSFAINFEPTSAGTKSTTLRYESNDPNRPMVDVPLLGTGLVQPIFSISPRSYNYGNVVVGTTSSQTFLVTNHGNLDLDVATPVLAGFNADQFAISRGDTAFVLAPGDTQEIEVSFSPTATGRKVTVLQLQTNDPNQASVSVSLTGEGVAAGPDIRLPRRSISYGAIHVDSSAVGGLTIENRGSQPLRVKPLLLPGPDSDQFVLDPPVDSLEIAPTSSFGLIIIFTPTSLGFKQATLRLESNDPDEPVIDIPVGGTGAEGDIAVTPDTVDFSPSYLGSKRFELLRVTNRGLVPLEVTSTSLTGPDARQFEIITGAAPFSLQGANFQDLVVTFLPESEGPANVMLEIASLDPDQPLLEVPIIANGMQPPPRESLIDLVFVIDVSGSVDQNEYTLQLEGFAGAVEDSNLVPHNGNVAVAVVQFASTARVNVPLTVISDGSDAAAVAQAIRNLDRTGLGGATAVGHGVNVASSHLSFFGRADARQAICLSTDGSPNEGPNIDVVIALAQDRGVDEMGVIAIESLFLVAFYQPRVFGGGGVGFVQDFVEFSNTVGQKIGTVIQPSRCSVVITAPAAGADITSDRVEVRGKITPENISSVASISCEVNGADAQVIGDSSFAVTVPLTPGINELFATCTIIDNEGNQAVCTDVISVFRLVSESCLVEITSHDDGDLVCADSTRVEAKLDSSALVTPVAFTCDINGFPASVQNSLLTAKVPVSSGENRLIVTCEVTDGNGQRFTCSDTVTVLVDHVPPTCKFTFDGTTVRGTMFDDESGIRELRTVKIKNGTLKADSFNEGAREVDFRIDIIDPNKSMSFSIDVFDRCENRFNCDPVYLNLSSEGATEHEFSFPAIDRYFQLTNSGLREVRVNLNGYKFKLLADAVRAGHELNSYAMPRHGIVTIDLAPYLTSGENHMLLAFEGPAGSAGQLLISDVAGRVDHVLDIKSLPQRFSLAQNYPNPFNPSTKIRFDVPETAGQTTHIELRIFNLVGELVRVLVDEPRDPGQYVVEWDAKNDAHRDVATGVYIYQLKAGNFRESRRMILMR